MQRTKKGRTHKTFEAYCRKYYAKWRKIKKSSRIIIAALFLLIFVVILIAAIDGTTKSETIDDSSNFTEQVSAYAEIPEPSFPFKDQNNSTENPDTEGTDQVNTSYTELYPDMVVEKSDFIEHVDGDKVIYLTFDDGPCGSTGRLLDVLDELNVKATFFVTAQFESDEQLVSDIKEIYDRGHALGVHTYSHDYATIYNSVADFLTDYKMMDDLIVEATGERSKIFRFAGGSNTSKNESIREDLIAEMERRGFIFHDWNSHNGDSEGYSKEKQIERAVKESTIKEKSVILMHNTPNKDSVIEALPEIVGKIKEEGYRFDVLDETVRPFQFSPSSR